MKKSKKLLKRIRNPKEIKRLEEWQSKLETAKNSNDEEVVKIIQYQAYYDGTKSIESVSTTPAKDANTVRNIVYEIIESQVDPSLPYPKVTPVREEDVEQARQIERALGNMIKTLKLMKMNDVSERDVPIKGGDLYLTEWDNSKSSHSSIGGVSITEIDPRNFIPQPGVTEIENMDYFFIRQAMTKKAVKKKYGVDVEDAEEEDPTVRGEDKISEDTDVVTVNMSYYKTEKEEIGLYVWCDDYELYNNENYQCREIEVCAECGLPKNGDVCECGSKKFEKEKQEYETLYESKMLADGSMLEPTYIEEEIVSDKNGEIIYDESGNPSVEMVVKDVEIPYYQPNIFPIVLRKNVSAKNKFLGKSDVEVIKDHQEAIKKIITKIQEKILTGGSIITLPEDTSIELTDKEMRVVRVKPNELNMVSVITLQPDISKDMAVQESHYQWAKSETGITDSYQGKVDTSATSGTSKQYSINQAAGRLESKRTMKAEAYASLYELMFKTWLAYSDQPLQISSIDGTGKLEFSAMDRYAFLKVDDAGEYYWNDEFIFETNPTSTLMANREAMWQQADLKLQSGAFGPLGELDTLQLYWEFMEKNNYPNAGSIKASIDNRKIKVEEQMQAQIQAQTQMQGGAENGMPVM